MFFPFLAACALLIVPATPRPLARYGKLRVVVRGPIEVDEISRRVSELKQAARVLWDVKEDEDPPVDVETSIERDGEAAIVMSMVFSMVVGGATP